MARAWAERIPATWRIPLALAIFVAVWVAADALSDAYVTQVGFSPWYLGTALDLALFYALGVRYWPVIVVAGAIGWHFTHSAPYTLLAALVLQTTIALGYAGLYRLLVEKIGVGFPLRTVRDVLLFVAVGAVIGPALIAVVAVIPQAWLGHIAWSSFAVQYVRFVVGDAVGLLVLFPPLVAALAWLLGRGSGRLGGRVVRGEDGIVLCAVVGSVVLCYVPPFGSLAQPVFVYPFLPLAWLAIRDGMRGAMLTVLVADASATVLQAVLHVPERNLIALQAFIGASAVVALVLGALALERTQLERRLRERAEIDELTGLGNVRRLLAWCRERDESEVGLGVVDVDEMRLLNEGIGREAADAVLVELARRLAGVVSDREIIVRLSADEFAVVTDEPLRLDGVITAMLQSAAAPFAVGEARLQLHLSLTTGRAQGGAADGLRLLREADAALDRAKRRRRGAPEPFDASAGLAPTLLAELHRALELGEFRAFYQPIYQREAASAAWRMVGVEALMRWQHPTRGIILPADFLDLLERLAIAEHVGWWMLDEALAATKYWRHEVADLRVFVNIFERQLADVFFEQRVTAALRRAGLPARALVVEISERIVAGYDQTVAAQTRRLRSTGVGVAIDDFGTGGSSLSRLREIPVDILKIDQSFVARSEVDAKARAVARAIVRLGDELGLRVIAEGVENMLQAGVILEMGCDTAQGYAFGHPMPGERIAELLSLTSGFGSGVVAP